MNIIQLLPDSIANQIAAGEVVQRPASVVKELLENSVDAGAKSVQLIVRDAGRTLVQVIDDGAGMTETDARLSFERHATSKIRQSDDLFRIRTMGFRGEALASIAAVAQVEMRTRRIDIGDDLGTLLRIESSEVRAQEPVSCLPGTNLLVKNLFFNVPARRNFLKSNSVEMRHILDEFQRVALAHPAVQFSLYHNDQEVYNLPAGKLSRRIVDTFGKNYREQLAYCEEETPYVKVRGYIGKPESARKTRGEQFFFVNNRFVRHQYLHHAVVGAYDGTLPDGCHPFYVLFIDIDPSHIDINIHPTKTEIKFDDERSVYAIVGAAVRKAVGVHNLAPPLDFESDVNFLDARDALAKHFLPKNNVAAKPSAGRGALPTESNVASAPNVPKPITPAWAAPVEERPAPTNQPVKQDWKAVFDGFEKPAAPTALRPDTLFPGSGDWLPDPVSAAPEATTLSSRANTLVNVLAASKPNTPSGEGEVTPEFTDEQTILQAQNRYLLAPVKSGVLLIDQRAAYDRILYTQFRASLSKQEGHSQQLLFPVPVLLSPADVQLAQELRSELERLGFQFDVAAPDRLDLRGVPALMTGELEEDLFSELLGQLRMTSMAGERTADARLDRLARSLSRRLAGRFVRPLTAPERKALIDQLFASENPSYAPGGEPITTVLTLDKLAGLFKP